MNNTTFCTECGQPVNPTDVFCKSCGAQQNLDSQQPSSNTMQRTVQGYSMPVTKNGNLDLRPVGGVVLFVGVMAAFYGINRLNSPASQFGQMLGQSDSVAQGSVVIGIVAALIGIVVLSFGNKLFVKQTERPIGVTILAILALIGGGFSLLGALVSVSSANVALGAMIGSILLVQAILSIAFGIGALQLKPWAWILGVVAQGLGILSAIWSVINGNFSSAILPLVIGAGILYYLFTPEVRRAFDKEKTFASM